MKTIGHHTSDNKGGKKYVIENVPFYSAYLPNQNKIPYLGAGYYFWDDNIEMAHIWGKTHYKNNYFIVEGDLKCDDEKIFDLVGNRRHISYFAEILEKFREKNYNRDNWEIGKFIEFLKDLENDDRYKGIFPFKVIKAIDNSWRNKQKSFKFVKNKKGYIYLDPKIMLCFIEKEEVNFYNREVIEPKRRQE
jgi:hypothetical protein